MDFSDYELREMLDETVEGGSIEVGTAAHGVALLCLDQGYSVLTEKQRSVFNDHVRPHLAKIAARREIEARRSGWPD